MDTDTHWGHDFPERLERALACARKLRENGFRASWAQFMTNAEVDAFLDRDELPARYRGIGGAR